MKKALLSLATFSLAAAAAPAQFVGKPAGPPPVINDHDPAPCAVAREPYKVHRNGGDSGLPGILSGRA
ncbi:MAG TPA: hypothetical protein VF668_17020 [Pyrinomonadaceae bacterium]|jgi:hypothetical protein